MGRRHASINDLAIAEAGRKFHWPAGKRPKDHPVPSDLEL
jgi:nuclear transport factor 2 (NTF2) superfamily protein